jgi:hypothetical protein
LNELRNIHLIFKTHLDIGFTHYASRVINDYLSLYIPSAMRVARQMRESGLEQRFIWTTGSYLIYEFLEQAEPAARREMESAILAGDIKWHALPFTTHTELEDPDLYRFGLSLSQELDQRFGFKTIAAKLTDVPGHTRGIVPLLAEAGVRFLHIGVNPGSTVPQVPPLFRWVDPSGADLVVMYESGYGSASVIEGSHDSLAFGHTGDNLGPQSTEQVLQVYREVEQNLPGSHVFASTLDAFAQTLEPLRSQLPVVTQEIGDTWIHGAGSDPIKVARYRELLRLRQEWLSQEKMTRGDRLFKAFHQNLMLIPEHTWGMDEKTWLGDRETYNPKDFSAKRGLPNFQAFESSWAEKRSYTQAAIDALEDSTLAIEARQRLESIRPLRPQLKEWTPCDPRQAVLTHADQQVRFASRTGAIVEWKQGQAPLGVADPPHPSGWLRYQTFSAADYERFFRQYILPKEQMNDWSRDDFTKPGLERSRAVSRWWQPSVQAAYIRQDAVLFHLMANDKSAALFGCPLNFYLRYQMVGENHKVEIELQWFDKQANRMPEALWFSFIPPLSKDGTLKIEKLGESVDPLDVVPNGNRHLHACSGSVQFIEPALKLNITSLDAPLVAPGQPSLLDFNNNPPDLAQGVHFNMLNNLWGTNFPMWFEEDCRFRFIMEME